MKFHRHTRITAFLALALLACSPGVLFAGCGVACPFGLAMAEASAHRCCRPSGGMAVKPASCCETVRAAVPVETSRAVQPPPMPLALASAANLPSEPVSRPALPEIPESPPPLHGKVGLYTLHAAFLI